MVEACRRALRGLEATAARDRLEDAARVGEQGGSWESLGLGGELSDAATLAVLVGVTTLRPKAFSDAGDVLAACGVDPATVLDAALIAAWAEAVAIEGRTELAAALLERCPYGPALPAVRALILHGDLAGARRLAETIDWTRKHDRGLALVELALAGDGRIDDAFEAIMSTKRIETGPDRGGAELHALAAIVARLARAEVGRESASACVEAMVSLGDQGQRRSRPTGFAVLLAEAASGVAVNVGARNADWLALAEQLRGAIVFDDIALRCDEPFAEARGRIEAGREVEDAAASSAISEPPEGWERESDELRRLCDATLAMAVAFADHDLERYFEALAIGLDADGPTDADRFHAWAAAEGPEAEQRLVTFVRDHGIEDNRWCFRGPAEPWEAVGEVRDPEAAEALLGALIDRDFVARAYGDWRRASSLSVPVAKLLRRFPRRAWLERVMSSFSTASRPKLDHRLFDFVAALGDHPELDLDALAKQLTDDRRWALWAGVARMPSTSLDELRERFGEPADAFVHEVCRRLAAAGRVDDALALAEHDRDRPTSRFDTELSPPPTQASLMAIAGVGVPLSAEQKKAMIRQMKDAPRRRGDGHSKRLKELRALLKVVPVPE